MDVKGTTQPRIDEKYPSVGAGFFGKPKVHIGGHTNPVGSVLNSIAAATTAQPVTGLATQAVGVGGTLQSLPSAVSQPVTFTKAPPAGATASVGISANPSVQQLANSIANSAAGPTPSTHGTTTTSEISTLVSLLQQLRSAPNSETTQSTTRDIKWPTSDGAGASVGNGAGSVSRKRSAHQAIDAHSDEEDGSEGEDDSGGGSRDMHDAASDGADAFANDVMDALESIERVVATTDKKVDAIAMALGALIGKFQHAGANQSQK